MLKWVRIFFVISIIAGVFGFLNIAAAATGVAKIVFFVAVVIFLILAFVAGRATKEEATLMPPAPFPGTLYDGDGILLAGDGAEFTWKLADDMPCKAVIRDRPGAEKAAVLEAGDRLWVLPDSFGKPPALPMPLLAELADVVQRGHKVGLAASNEEAYLLVREALMLLLNGSSGRT